MPVIKQYETGPLELRPSEVGVEAAASAARRLGTFSNQVAGSTAEVGRRTGAEIGSAIQAVGTEGVNQITAHQVSHGAATFAKISDDLTNAWNETVKNADPNDPSVAAKFRETALEPALQKFTEGFNTEAGQKWAEAHIEHLRSHMFEKTAADMATLAGQAARVNHIQTVNALSNMALNDPSSLDYALKTHDSAIGGMIDTSPNLKGAAAGNLKGELTEKGREQIVKSAALGYINKTAQVPPWASDPKYSKYINGTELQMFQKNAVAQQRANTYYEKQAAALEKQQADLKVHQDAADLFAKSVVVDQSNPNRVLVQPDFVRRALDIARNNPTAPSAAATAKAYIDWAESQTRQRAEPVVSDAATKSALLTGMFDPNKPTTETDILKAEATDKLSTRDGTILRQLVKTTGPDALHDPLVHTAIQAASERVGVGLVGDGHERYANFMQAFWPQYLAQKRANTLPPNALDLKDEKSLIRQALKAYEPPEADRMMMHMLKNMGINNIDQITKSNTNAPAAALPPIANRERGKVYPTPRGDMKWTGTGWVSP